MKLDADNESERKRIAALIRRDGLGAFLREQARAWGTYEDDEDCATGYNTALAEAAEKLEQAAQAAKESNQ